MPIHTIKLISKREVANQTFIYTFEKPSGFTFEPGQYGGFTLINPPIKDAAGITRRFSLLNIPSDNNIQILTRIQLSAYKKVLNSLNSGEEIKLAGPTGQFVLHQDATIPAVFLAGGVGISPFYSMIRSACLQNFPQKIYLFYGNQTLADAALIPELTAISNEFPNFKFIPTFNLPESDWQGETGFITQTMLKKYVTDIHSPIYYICGSPIMVTTLQELIMEMGIDSSKIKVEDFPGY